MAGTTWLKYALNTAPQTGSAGRTMSSVTTRPPPIVTRRISASPRSRSSRFRKRNADSTQANAPSRNGSAIASADRDGEVGRARGEIQHGSRGRVGDRVRRAAPPGVVPATRHEGVHEVVAPGDARKHAPHGRGLRR